MRSKAKQNLSSCRYERIQRHSEFERVLRANRLNNKWFIVHAQKNEAHIARLGIITSKKIMSKAVTRNFAKRLVREVFRYSISANCDLDIVVKVRRPINKKTSNEGRLALAQLLQVVQIK